MGKSGLNSDSRHWGRREAVELKWTTASVASNVSILSRAANAGEDAASA